MTVEVTADLIHQMVTGAHAEGITALAIQAVVSHYDRVLLLADHGADFTDRVWRLPGALVLPGQTLTDALYPAAASIGLSIEEVTGYLGHHDHADEQTTRTFTFAVTVTDPDAICHSAQPCHHWGSLDEFDQLPTLLDLQPTSEPADSTTSAAAGGPLLTGPLRRWARGAHSDEASVELLIAHRAFLHRRDFLDRFIDTATSTVDGAELASIDWTSAINALNTGELACSSSEQRILRLAASIAEGIPVNLRDALTGIDTDNAHLLTRAILHANGHQPPLIP